MSVKVGDNINTNYLWYHLHLHLFAKQKLTENRKLANKHIHVQYAHRHTHTNTRIHDNKRIINRTFLFHTFSFRTDDAIQADRFCRRRHKQHRFEIVEWDDNHSVNAHSLSHSSCTFKLRLQTMVECLFWISIDLTGLHILAIANTVGKMFDYCTRYIVIAHMHFGAEPSIEWQDRKCQIKNRRTKIS